MIPLRDTIRSRHFPIMTWLILGTNALVFFYELTLGPNQLLHFTNQFALVPGTLQTSPLWFATTVFTSMFMHAGWFHFLSNMWILFIFGDNVEDRMGSLSFLIFYLLSGIAAALLQTLIFSGSTIPVLGASGAIAGVLGAYIFLFPSARVVTFVPIFFFLSVVKVPAIIYIGFWFVSQLFSGIASIGAAGGGVAWWAHIGGFLVGLAATPFFLHRSPPPPDYLDTYASRR
ncbi:MAG: rhomboid family intramembrane serine protease [Chloroflexi bacterium]|nr:rhomboid family intramembrane serine protease [Chloroflexota bacterium]MQC25956.1 rhomboid family intramembrane serine protease [Chloroflexota bacterium]